MDTVKIDNEIIKVNWQPFVYDTSGDPVAFGMTEDDVKRYLYISEQWPEGSIDDGTGDDFNNIGLIFNDGICVPVDYSKAVHWFELAIERDNALAKSNLADILRKGLGGIKVNYKRAFELYKSCGLPYGHYRVGEFYEHGWGIEQDLVKAKIYYRLSYKEGHFLAKKKLESFDFLSD